VFNLGSGQSHSVTDVLAIVAAQLGAEPEADDLPDLPGEAFETLADTTRARALGWSPRISLDEGLRRSIAFIREHVVPAAPARP